MAALFINIKIDQEERFDIFKITLSEIESLFDECHIKIRGAFADQCIIFAKKLFTPFKLMIIECAFLQQQKIYLARTKFKIYFLHR